MKFILKVAKRLLFETLWYSRNVPKLGDWMRSVTLPTTTASMS